MGNSLLIRTLFDDDLPEHLFLLRPNLQDIETFGHTGNIQCLMNLAG